MPPAAQPGPAAGILSRGYAFVVVGLRYIVVGVAGHRRQSGLIRSMAASQARADGMPSVAWLSSKATASMLTMAHPWRKAARSSSWLTRRGPSSPGWRGSAQSFPRFREVRMIWATI